MTLRERQAAFGIMDAKLVLKADELGTPIVCLEYLRSVERQQYLVSIGRSKTLNSKHIIGLAKDYAFLKDIQDDGKINYRSEKYKAIGEFWESLGGRWGGRFGDNLTTEVIEGWDCGHFEMRD